VLKSAGAAIVVGTAVGCASVVGARIAVGRHMFAGAMRGTPRTTPADGADVRASWLADGELDTSELSPYAPAIVIDPRP
jgi:hypothetical protein